MLYFYVSFRCLFVWFFCFFLISPTEKATQLYQKRLIVKSFNHLKQRTKQRKLFQMKILSVSSNFDTKWTKAAYLEFWLLQTIEHKQRMQQIEVARLIFDKFKLVESFLVPYFLCISLFLSSLRIWLCLCFGYNFNT